MPNGDMPTWEEWNEQLTEEQRQYSLYKILEAMNKTIHGQGRACQGRLDGCNKIFATQKEMTWLTWGFRAIFGAFILSIVGAILIKLT